MATLVDAPSLDPREIEPFTTDEAHRILAAAAGQRNAVRWSVALAHGLRQGEAPGLAWDAVDEGPPRRAGGRHDARHTAATLLLTQGVPARVAMQILGHSQISLTLGTHSYVVPELALDAAERVGAAL